MVKRINVNVSEKNLKWLEMVAKITNQDAIKILEKLVEIELDRARSSITVPEDFTKSDYNL